MRSLIQKQTLTLSSTVSGTIAPRNAESSVTMYVCGVTPYDDAHIGHGRCYVTFDLIYRLLQATGSRVIYCRNVTDIDDKLLNRAERELGSAKRYQEIAEKYTARYREDITRLGCLPPTYEPLVTENIAEIISCITTLIAKGYAYQVDGDVYFSIARYPSYGTLSKQRIADMRAGARVDIDEKKHDPLDFALWKAEADGTFWQSPWGWGRPGWHIECSAMALRFLGMTIDLHGGGMDLMFPHHENERAQSECCTGSEFARIWVHNAFVRVKEEKMSKSLGNFVTLRQAYEQINPMVLRYYYLTHHYRNPLDFSWNDAAAAEKAYRKLITLCSEYATTQMPDTNLLDHPDQQCIAGMIEALYQDCNVQKALSMIFEQMQELRQKPVLVSAIAWICTELLGLDLAPLPEITETISPEIQALLDERTAARMRKDWKRADELRAELAARNITVRDEKL